MMVKEIRRYHGKMGEITVTMYDEGEGIQYHVKHHGMNTANEWFCDWQKANAIAYAQFLAGKY